MMTVEEKRPKGANAVKRFFQRLRVIRNRLVLCINGGREVAAAIEKKPVMAENLMKAEPKVPEMVVISKGRELSASYWTSGFC
jgi:hypothetical protein